jgi:DNA-binding MarR family transcriptional regulator
VLQGRPESIASLTFAHGFALRYISEHEPVTSSDLARHLRVSRQATSQLVASFENLRLISRAPNPNNRSSQFIRLAPAGKTFLVENHQRWDEIQAEWDARFGRETVSTIQRVLESFLTEAETPVHYPKEYAATRAKSRPTTGRTGYRF